MRVLTWLLGVAAGLLIVILGNVITLSYQLGGIAGRLDVLIGHVSLK
jgi:hypothetical protein